MRSNGLATILLLIPVLAVPALAIFGIHSSPRSSRRHLMKVTISIENHGWELRSTSSGGIVW